MKKTKPSARTVINIRVAPERKARIREAARREGKSMSAYMVDRALAYGEAKRWR